jgi:hypothetical protein
MPRFLILIALLILGATAAGCGGKPTSSGVAQLPSATTGTTTTSSQIAGAPTGKSKAEDIGRFSRCMRSHGVPNFPDPKPSGGGMSLTFGSRTGINPDAPQFKAAQKSCEKLLPNGGKTDPAMQAKAQAQMLAFSACMRSHGLANFPDPQFSGGQARLKIDKSGGLNPRSPVFQAAQKACESVMPGPAGGAKGGPATSSSGSGNGPSSQMSAP